jgi:hypothetical protein
MAWRKWMVRSVVFTVAGGIALAAFAYQHWTDPAVIRRQVLASLEEHLPGARVSLESARLRGFDGISFSELRLARRDDPSHTDFMHVPSGTIYPDKEQLLSGKLAIRRIVWREPTLHLIRGEEGGWNVAGLAPLTAEHAVPIIVLQKATLLVEDRYRRSEGSLREVRDVNLVVMNDPHRLPAISLLTFKGTAVADLAGELKIDGTFDRISNAFTVAVHVPSFPVDGRLVQQLSYFCPEAGIHARQLTGTGTLQAELSYRPESEQPWHHRVRWQLTKGRFSHAKLPFPLEHLQASVQCVDGHLTLEELTAQLGSAQVHLSGKAVAPKLDTDMDGRLVAEHVTLTRELLDVLPDSLHDIEQDYSPRGSFSLALDFSRRAGQWRQQSTVQLQNMTGVCAKFPYRLENITGTITQETDPSKLLDLVNIDLIGYAGSQPVSIHGELKGKKPASVNLQIRAQNVPMDDKLCAALQPKFQDLVRAFHPSGYVDIKADLRRTPGESQFANEYVAHFHDAAISYDVFPYPLERVSGTLTIQPDYWEYRDFQGTHKGGEFRSQGKSVHAAQGSGATIKITGTSVLLDAELRAALKRPALDTAWEKLNPGGRMNFEAQVDLLPNQNEPVIDVIVSPRNCTLRPAFFPYALAGLVGTIHYHQHEVEITKLAACHEGTRLFVEKGEVLLNPDGGFSVKLVNLLGDPIVPDAEFLQALPPALSRACTSLRIEEPFSLLTNHLAVAMAADPKIPPWIDWDGGVRLKDATLVAGATFQRVNGTIWCGGEHRGGTFGNVQGNIELDQATVANQTLRDIHSPIVVNAKEPDFLILPNLNAHLYGGNVAGSVRVQFGASLRYEADLNALQIQLEELSRSNHLGPNALQHGPLNAHLYLKGQGTELSGLKGWGSIDVPNGKMYNLPLLLDLLKFLALRLPDHTLFEEAHARFTMDGSRIDISRIDLLGAAISFGGSGTVNLDSSIFNMDLYAVWGRIVQLSPPLIREIWPTLSKQLLKIKMKGKLGETPKFEREPVPGLIEPLERVLERIAGRQSGGRGEAVK